MNRVVSRTVRAGRSAMLEESLYKTEYDLEPRKNVYYYKYEIPKHARQGGPGIHKAIELFQEMKSKSRLTPQQSHFSSLIYGCARSGHTKKAFELYEESLKYLKSPSNSIVTCLLNACAESPFPEYGLKRLDWFITHLRVNHANKAFNEIHYNTAIKAYGKLGRLEEASKLIKEMIDNGVSPTTNTFNMLLIGCASNKENGTMIALRVYKRMKMYDLKPDLITYRLLLRCIRDCGLGSAQLIEQTIRELPALTSLDQRLKNNKPAASKSKSSRRRSEAGFVWTPLLSDIGSSMEEAVKVNDINVPIKAAASHKELVKFNEYDDEVALTSPDTSPPNLLSEDHLKLMFRIKGLNIDKLQTSSDRLNLFGGLYGYLESMIRDSCKPDTKTFSLLLSCIYPTQENFLNYHELTKKFNIKRDRLYYDLLIESICKTGHDIDFALKFLDELHTDGLRPHITTFESFASGCYSWSKAKELISNLETSGFVVSDKIIREFFSYATKFNRFHYLTKLIELSVNRNFRPTKILVEKLEASRLHGQELLLKKEKGQLDASQIINESNLEWFDTFRVNLKGWLEKVELDVEEHPWALMKETCRRDPSREWQSNFVEHFKALDKAKSEALKNARPIGNLNHKAKLIMAQSNK